MQAIVADAVAAGSGERPYRCSGVTPCPNRLADRSPTRQPLLRDQREEARWQPVHHQWLKPARAAVANVWWYAFVACAAEPSAVVRKRGQRWEC
jgi:hypothetical protein